MRWHFSPWPWDPCCPKRSRINTWPLLLVSFIRDPKYWCFLIDFFLHWVFITFFYDYHTYFGSNTHKGHFISFNAVSFSNMDMILGGCFFRICTIISNSVSFSPVVKASNSWISYHHHISASGRFSSLSLAYSMSGLDPSSSAGETVVTGPIPSLDRSVGITVTFWSRGGDLKVM